MLYNPGRDTACKLTLVRGEEQTNSWASPRPKWMTMAAETRGHGLNRMINVRANACRTGKIGAAVNGRRNE